MGIALILLVAITVRAWILFSTPYMPGVNGAYYLVQARALLERGSLGIPDMPLTFFLHAALAWLMTSLGGLPRSDAIVLAVKVCDASLPALVALPVFMLLRRWANDMGRGLGIPLAAAALAVLAPPWLLLVGELQKNSLAMVFLALLFLLLRDWLETPTPNRGLALLACLVPLGFTHIGVLGAALVLLAATLAVFALQSGRRLRIGPQLPWLIAGIVILGITSALVAWKFDPSRIGRLITALSDPSRFASDGRQGPMPPGGAPFLDTWLPFPGFAAAVLPALVIAWKRRADMKDADLVLIAGAAITVLAITGPWLGMDKLLRFSIIALLPAIILVSFALLHIPSARLRAGLIIIALVLCSGASITLIIPGGKAILDARTMEELKSLTPLIHDPAHTTIVTEHGVEWWSAWLLKVHIAQIEAISSNNWKDGDAMLFLEVKAGRTELIGRGGPPNRPGGPQNRPEGNPGHSSTGSPGSGSGSPPDRPPMIPPDAEILHDGKTLKLARVATPPDFPPGDRAIPRHN